MTMHAILLLSFLMVVSLTSESVYAQSFCANESPIFIENFGSGTASVSNPDIIPGSLIYRETGDLDVEGVYRVTNNTQQKPDWHAASDHTGNTNGRMLVLNGKGNTFYSHVVNNPTGFQAGYYAVGMFFMNVNKAGNCPSGPAPTISFLLEYQAQDNSWIALGGSTVSVPLLGSPTWIQLGSVFTLPVTGAFTITNMRLSINDGTVAICGNDFAIDDLKLATCASGGPLPVEFSGISARQRGTGIAIDWSTSSESNSKYFDVEKSINGGKSWSMVSTVEASGNSTVVKKYTAFDGNQVVGLNYYRIKQVDMDGKFKYSYTVQVKISLEKSGASVISNPFNTNLGIDFFSKSNQSVSLALFDVTGKKVATFKMAIPIGTSRKIFDLPGNIQKGVYVLNIVDEAGYSMYKGKLVKE